MSASTLSITANPAASTPRREVLATDKTNNNVLERVSSAAGDGDKIAANTNKDLSHSIRGEKVLEIKKPLKPNSTVRRRKLAPSKPLWMPFFSAIIKYFLLLLVLTGLVHMVMMGFLDMEGRIVETESYVKMLQLQLETVEHKFEGEVSRLRGDINKLDEKNTFIEKALSQLTSKDLLSKEDIARFYEEFRNSKIGDSGHDELGLDEIRSLARQIVEKEIGKHAADGLGRVDYALASGGAMVVKHSEPFGVGNGRNLYSTTTRQGVHNDAQKMLKPSFGEPGQCFPLKGNSGFVQIKLRTAINPDAVTLEHVSKSVAYDRSSAPRDCRVYGWMQSARDLDTESSIENDKTLLTEFTYDLDKSNAQTFNVFDSASSAIVNTIRFEFSSNHGSLRHTCIYRIRVHGHESKSLTHLDGIFPNSSISILLNYWYN